MNRTTKAHLQQQRNARQNAFGRERYHLPILVAKENKCNDTMERMQSLIEKWFRNQDCQKDCDYEQRFGELMRQYRDEYDSLMSTQREVEKYQDKQVIKE